MRKSFLLAAASTLLWASPATAQPLAVNYNVTGSAGNWMLDFSVSNLFAPSTDYSFYWFGVNLPANSIVSSPAGWTPYLAKTVSMGSGTTYRDTWYIAPPMGVAMGQILGGFTARVTSASAPTSVGWFAYAFSNTVTSYDVGDNFNGSTYNPGFEGTAQGTFPQINIVTLDEPQDGPFGGPGGDQLPVSTVPEPSTYALMAAGLAAIGFASRRRRTA